MVIKRKKIDRAVDLTTNADKRVIELPPAWRFTVICKHHGEITFDFTPYLSKGRENLTMHMRDAIWSLRNEVVGVTLAFNFQGFAIFWRFLDDLETAGQPITRLDQIDGKVIRQYLTWLEQQIVSQGKNKGDPWGVRMRKGRFFALKALLVNRRKYVPEAVNPKLSFPKNPFPNSNRAPSDREPYSDSEQKRILTVCNLDLKQLHTGQWTENPRQVLALHAVIIGLALGPNLSSLLDIRRDSLRPHPLEDRQILILHKRRGYSTQVKSSKQKTEDGHQHTITPTIPATVGEHLSFLCEYTTPLMDEVRSEDRDFVFLYRAFRYKQNREMTCRMNEVDLRNGLRDFVRRHKLQDDRGEELKLNLARLRPTFATNLYRLTRDLRKVQQALGHSNPQITARLYAKTPPEAERNHAFIGQSMVDWLTSQEVTKAMKLAADQHIPLHDAQELLSGGYNTVIARCKNPFRENEAICGKYMACFKCPSMIVFQDDLYRLFSFYYKLLAERIKIASHHWIKTYGWVIKVIDEQIVPQFDPIVVEEAKRRARENPHPAWGYQGAGV